MDRHGSFPGFLIGMNPAPSSSAIGAASMNPRLSMPATCVTPRLRAGAAIAVMVSANSTASASTGVMSLKTMPGLGKSVTSRSVRCSRAFRSPSRDTSAVDVEGIRERPRLIAGHVLHPFDRRPGGTDLQCSTQSIEGPALAACLHLHFAARQVGHPAAEPQPSGLLTDEPTEANALHPAADPDGQRVHLLLLP